MFDLTAANIAGKYPGKDGLKMLIHLVFKVFSFLCAVICCENLLKKKIRTKSLKDKVINSMNNTSVVVKIIIILVILKLNF